jgi:hypothetical protein
MGARVLTSAEVVWALVAATGVVLLLAGAVMAWRARSRRRGRTRALRRVFGAEYARTVTNVGGRFAAEAELTTRLRRANELWLRDLDATERQQAEADWAAAAAAFVNSPAGALHEADALVTRVMGDRGYPVERFEERAGLVSLEHPDLAELLRAAHRVTVLANEGLVADTERMRQAFVAYRRVLDAMSADAEPVAERG